MRRIAMVLASLVIGFFPLPASISQAADTGAHQSHHAKAARPADTGNRFCMSGSAMMDVGMMSTMMKGGMMSGMVMGSPRHTENANTSPDCGMSESDGSANQSASCSHEMVRERRASECGA